MKRIINIIKKEIILISLVIFLCLAYFYLEGFLGYFMGIVVGLYFVNLDLFLELTIRKRKKIYIIFPIFFIVIITVMTYFLLKYYFEVLFLFILGIFLGFFAFEIYIQRKVKEK